MLPCERIWVEKCANLLLEGELVFLRGLPRTGKTSLALAVHDALGKSAIYVRGREFTLLTQNKLRTDLLETLQRTADTEGFAQLIFDDYGNALRCSKGGTLQSNLFHELVDGEHARDIGALFVSRWSDPIHIRQSGSPLVSRARHEVLPEVTTQDLLSLGFVSPLEDIQIIAGRLPAFVKRLHNNGASPCSSALEQILRADLDTIVHDLPAEGLEVIGGARNAKDASGLTQEAIRPLNGLHHENGFRLIRAADVAGLKKRVNAMASGWPKARAQAVERFSKFLDGAIDVLWVDRYLYSEPEILAAFLREVCVLQPVQFRLLGTRQNMDLPRMKNALKDLSQICARIMAYGDWRDLHDRHLIVPAERKGFVLPTSRVVLSIDSPGSAVAAELPHLSVDYEYFWSRGTDIAFLP